MSFSTYGLFFKRFLALLIFSCMLFSISGVIQNFSEKKKIQIEFNEEEIDTDNSEEENNELEDATNLKIFYAFYCSKPADVEHVKSVKKLQFNVLDRSFLPNIPPPENVL